MNDPDYIHTYVDSLLLLMEKISILYKPFIAAVGCDTKPPYLEFFSICFAYLIFIAKNIWCQLRLHTFVYLPSHIHLYMMNINVLAHSLIFSKIKISHFRFTLSIRYHCYFWSLVSTGIFWIANSNNVYPLHDYVGIYH